MEDKPTILLLGEIKGTLDQFKDDTGRRFDELHEVIKVANDRAVDADKKAEKAHDYAQGVVHRAVWVSTAFVGAFTTLIWFVKNKALATIIGIN